MRHARFSFLSAMACVIILAAAGVSLSQSWNIRAPVRPVFPGVAIIIKVDQNLQSLTLRYDTNQIMGEYKITSCFVDENARLEKHGTVITLSDLREGDIVEIEGKIYDDENRSCGVIKLIQRLPMQSPSPMETP